MHIDLAPNLWHNAQQMVEVCHGAKRCEPSRNGCQAEPRDQSVGHLAHATSARADCLACFPYLFALHSDPLPPRGGGGGWHKASVSDSLLLAAPIGLTPLLILTLCGSERVLVVSTEPLDDLSCLTTPGSVVLETSCCPCR